MGAEGRGGGTTGSVEIVDRADAGEVAQAAADRLARALREAVASRGEATLALSGGNTPRDAYAVLARAPGVEWSRVAVFWVDERAVTPDHERSNYRAAKVALLDTAGIPAERIHRMRGEEADLVAAARAYERLVDGHVAAGPTGVPAFDVMVLGMGDDGHTASLFPGEPSVTVSDRRTIDVPARAGREARLTLTAPVIQAARNVVILVVGGAKRTSLESAWAAEGDILQAPIRLVRSCRGAVTWLVDHAAAGATRMK
jgi:6-phosphogluconolactonase